MWRWLWIILLVVPLGLMPVGVSADTSLDVVVTATGYICGTPGGFTLTYISDYEVGISWVKGADAENTMIRASYGRVPENRDDGYLVYYGDGTTASDTGVNFDEGTADVIYRAWSQNAGGVWEEVGVNDFMENPYMLLAILGFLALGFTVVSFVFKKGFLAFAGAAVWMITGIYCFSRAFETWDTYFSLGFLFLFLTVVFSFSPLSWRETTPAEETPEEPDVRGMREELEGFDRERNQYDFLYKNRQPKRNSPRLPRLPR